MDGASRLGALWRIVLPVSLPGILTVVIFTFSLVRERVRLRDHVHHELRAADVYGRRPDRPDPGRRLLLAALMAATLIPAIPLALLYNAFLDRFIEGFTGGAFR